MGCVSVRDTPTEDLRPLLNTNLEKYRAVLDNAAEYRVQILVSEVVTNRSGHGSLVRHRFRVGAEYFYPASSIKLCAAVAALETIEKLCREHRCLDLLNAPFEIAPLFPGDPPQTNDPSNLTSDRITVGHEIRKLALVSDNQAFNRLLELVGHDDLNRRMHRLGLGSVVINNRLSETRNLPNPRATATVTLRPPGAPAVVVPARTNSLVLTNRAARLTVGTGYVKGERLVRESMNFSTANGIALADLQDLLVKVVRPDISLSGAPLRLTEPHRAFLLQAMAQYPRESANPLYPAEQFPDDYTKFLLPGVRRVFPETTAEQRVTILGKVGQAYGFTIENCFLRNPANGREVFVAAVIYTNADGVLNDDKYEYDSLALPFMADLGELVARRWLTGEK